MKELTTTSSKHTLPAGSILHSKYIIDQVLGEGGFGITYAGHFSSENDTTVSIAIKEYFPSGVATRDFSKNPPLVTHFDGEFATSFHKGLYRFLNEAVLLKDFNDLPSIVSVIDVFEENGTAYLVMDYIEGITLKNLILQDGPMPMEELLDLMKPVLKDLTKVHEKGLIHRDISPDNLIVGLDNHLHLIDFGAASYSNPNETKTMTVILKAGYAPPEQYISDGKIGTWTDVYALCATMYMALTGHAPTDAIKRMQEDRLEDISPNTGITPNQAHALRKGLQLNYAHRYATVKLFYHALTTTTQLEEKTVAIPKYQATVNNKPNDKAVKKNGRLTQWVIAIVVLLLVFTSGAFGYAFLQGREGTKQNTEQTITTEAQTTENLSTATTEQTSSQNLVTDDASILTMVNIVGEYTEHAKNRIAFLDPDIQVQTIEEYSNEYASGTVISQSIAAQTQFTKGNITNIVLTVSKGSQPTTQTQQRANNNTKSSNYNVKSSGTTKKTNDGYTNIHLD